MAQKDKKPHLGKGLSALLGDTFTKDIKDPERSDVSEFPVDTELKSRLCEIPVSQIRANPYQPRKQWNEDELKELAESIRQSGLLQPILVRPLGSGGGDKRVRSDKIRDISIGKGGAAGIAGGEDAGDGTEGGNVTASGDASGGVGGAGGEFAAGPDMDGAGGGAGAAAGEMGVGSVDTGDSWTGPGAGGGAVGLAEEYGGRFVPEGMAYAPEAKCEYEIIAGERRYWAAQMAGLEAVPAIVREATDEQMLELALIENIHREDLNPIDRARAYKQYLDQFGLTHADGAARLGEDRSVISNYMRMLDLPREIQQMLIDRELSMGHARALQSLSDDGIKRKIAVRAMTDQLSVREVEQMVRRQLEKSRPGRTAEAKEKSAHIVDLENAFRDRLGTKVVINANKSGQKGKIVIEFYSLDEFDRISEKMGLWYEKREGRG